MIHIACSTDDNYAQLCGVMLCSLLENNKKHSFHIHILENGLSVENIDKFLQQCQRYNAKCSFHIVNDQLLEKCKYRTTHHRLSKAAYYRILLPSTLQDVDKVIYLDCDMVVLSDLSSVYDIEISPYSLAAVEDYGLLLVEDHLTQLEFNNEDKYFNSGFLVINLKYWREHNSEKQLLDFATKERKVFCHDQDALNYVFKNSWLRLPPKWNHFNIFTFRINPFYSKIEYKEFFSEVCVIHFADKYFKPWFKTPFVPYRKIWNKYMQMSDFNNIVQKSNDKSIYTILKITYLQFKIVLFKVRYKLLWS